MNPDDWKRLGILVDTDNPLDLAFAVAARGVLAGASANDDLLRSPLQWRNFLAAVMNSSDVVDLHLTCNEWSIQLGSMFSAVELAEAWRQCISDLKTQGKKVRIAVQPSLGGSRWTTDAALIARSLIYSNGHGDARSIASVFTQVDLAHRNLDHWPLRIGILPDKSGRALESALGSISMVEHGLAEVSMLTPGKPECDILLARYSLRELRRQAFLQGIVPSASVIIVPNEGLENRTQRRVLLQRLQSDLGVGIVVTGMPYGAEAPWMNSLVKSLSHRETLDVAVWDADRDIRNLFGQDNTRPPPTPMIFANAASLLQPPIDLQIADLQTRLAGLNLSLLSGRVTETGSQYSFAYALETARISLNQLSYGREIDGATNVANVAGEVIALEAFAAGTDPRPPLYGDATFFDPQTGLRVDDHSEFLIKGREYELEVALRRHPTGISSRKGPLKPVTPLPPGKEIDLLVVVQASEGDFKVLQPTQSLRLPADTSADSDPVRFPIRPLRSTLSESQLCCVEIRIYFDFNLIEIFVVRAAVRGEFDELPDELPNPAPIFVDQSERVDRGYQDMERWQVPRHLGIDIRREGDLARFTFTARGGSALAKQKLVLHGQLDIQLTLLMPLLNKMRSLWEEIAVDMIGATLQPAVHVFHSALLQLAQAGRDLWSLLFKGVTGSSMYVIGEWLWSHPAPDGAVVDIRLLDGATAFAFPWSLLYDREIPPDAKTADPVGFWGIRYAIGQSAMGWYQGDSPIVPQPASRLEFMLWSAFPNGERQAQFLKSIETSSKNRLTIQPPIVTRSAFDDMVRECDADMLYFYTHGHTRPVAADSGYDPVQRIRQRFEQLSLEQRAASGLQPLYDLITTPDFQPEESWIALTWGRLKLQELRAQRMNLRRAPVVFLNMCQSAQVMPGLADSFVTLFLERRARSVLGTECPITTIFAHPFSERLLREFFAGKSLGESLRLTRLHFMNQRNPLGLAYSLYGAATARYDPALL